ncbi:PREDICTED: C-type lectin domain family 17, member A-like [Phaethon lepturus]|uniref:C-type lectin domain family 17, member A-like n=1 Tax=Phaethon lepturus TaxID=97097 RepID=UPI000530A62A|nr:PREDICTED: C-type lectin domain family 17, member A-like [Phaethon lepturus]
MSQGEGAIGTYKKWDFDEEMELEKQERRKVPKGVLSILASSPERAVTLLYVLLAFTFVLFMALTIVNLQRVSAAWEALEQARMWSENSHTTAWYNLSEVQHTLDKHLSGELKAIHGRLLNEERDALEPVLRQLAEVKQEQSRASALLDAALEEMRNLSEIFCTRCPAGWEQFAKSCYFFSSTTKPWQAANDSCANFNAHLAIVNTEQENKFLANHVMETRIFWLGLTDMHNEGNWQWVDGRSLSLSYVFSLIGGFWNSGEPNNVGHHGEDCGSIYSSGGWNDVTCSSDEAWICERSC